MSVAVQLLLHNPSAPLLQWSDPPMLLPLLLLLLLQMVHRFSLRLCKGKVVYIPKNATLITCSTKLSGVESCIFQILDVKPCDPQILDVKPCDPQQITHFETCKEQLGGTKLCIF